MLLSHDHSAVPSGTGPPRPLLRQLHADQLDPGPHAASLVLRRPSYSITFARGPRGFTLIELVVVIIILGLLAAVAVPRYIALGQSARVAAVQTMQGALWTAATNAHTACMLNSNCTEDVDRYIGLGGIATRTAGGYPDAGDAVNDGEIDVWVNTTGYSIVVIYPYTHKFTLDGAPDPANCSALYGQATSAGTLPTITTLTSGC
jgi:MSHA pilin protein MshA